MEHGQEHPAPLAKAVLSLKQLQTKKGQIHN